jgi:hypothetical protein
MKLKFNVSEKELTTLKSLKDNVDQFCELLNYTDNYEQRREALHNISYYATQLSPLNGDFKRETEGYTPWKHLESIAPMLKEYDDASAKDLVSNLSEKKWVAQLSKTLDILINRQIHIVKKENSDKALEEGFHKLKETKSKLGKSTSDTSTKKEITDCQAFAEQNFRTSIKSCTLKSASSAESVDALYKSTVTQLKNIGYIVFTRGELSKLPESNIKCSDKNKGIFVFINSRKLISLDCSKNSLEIKEIAYSENGFKQDKKSTENTLRENKFISPSYLKMHEFLSKKITDDNLPECTILMNQAESPELIEKIKTETLKKEEDKKSKYNTQLKKLDEEYKSKKPYLVLDDNITESKAYINIKEITAHLELALKCDFTSVSGRQEILSHIGTVARLSETLPYYITGAYQNTFETLKHTGVVIAHEVDLNINKENMKTIVESRELWQNLKGKDIPEIQEFFTELSSNFEKAKEASKIQTEISAIKKAISTIQKEEPTDARKHDISIKQIEIAKKTNELEKIRGKEIDLPNITHIWNIFKDFSQSNPSKYASLEKNRDIAKLIEYCNIKQAEVDQYRTDLAPLIEDVKEKSATYDKLCIAENIPELRSMVAARKNFDEKLFDLIPAIKKHSETSKQAEDNTTPFDASKFLVQLKGLEHKKRIPAFKKLSVDQTKLLLVQINNDAVLYKNFKDSFDNAHKEALINNPNISLARSEKELAIGRKEEISKKYDDVQQEVEKSKQQLQELNCTRFGKRVSLMLDIVETLTKGNLSQQQVRECLMQYGQIARTIPAADNIPALKEAKGSMYKEGVSVSLSLQDQKVFLEYVTQKPEILEIFKFARKDRGNLAHPVAKISDEYIKETVTRITSTDAEQLRDLKEHLKTKGQYIDESYPKARPTYNLDDPTNPTIARNNLRIDLGENYSGLDKLNNDFNVNYTFKEQQKHPLTHLLAEACEMWDIQLKDIKNPSTSDKLQAQANAERFGETYSRRPLNTQVKDLLESRKLVHDELQKHQDKSPNAALEAAAHNLASNPDAINGLTSIITQRIEEGSYSLRREKLPFSVNEAVNAEIKNRGGFVNKVRERDPYVSDSGFAKKFEERNQGFVSWLEKSPRDITK